MNRDQVKEIFKLVKNTYSQFEVTSEKINIWTRLLKNDNPAKVMINTERYILENKFPPTIADIRAPYKEEHTQDFLMKLEKWESESCGGKPTS